MAGLDDAGMNRADRDFEDAFALDVTKPVLALLPAERLIPQELFHQWMDALGPVFVANQAAEIRMALRDQPEQISNFSLIPLRRVDVRGNRGKEALLSENVHRHQHPLPVQAEQILDLVFVLERPAIDGEQECQTALKLLVEK